MHVRWKYYGVQYAVLPILRSPWLKWNAYVWSAGWGVGVRWIPGESLQV